MISCGFNCFIVPENHVLQDHIYSLLVTLIVSATT